MKIKAEFSTDNAAFIDDPDNQWNHIAQQIKKTACEHIGDATRRTFTNGLYDLNGNLVGKVSAGK